MLNKPKNLPVQQRHKTGTLKRKNTSKHAGATKKMPIQILNEIEQEITRFLSDLIRINTTNPPGNETQQPTSSPNT